MDRGAWWDAVHQVTKSDMTEVTWHALINCNVELKVLKKTHLNSGEPLSNPLHSPTPLGGRWHEVTDYYRKNISICKLSCWVHFWHCEQRKQSIVCLFFFFFCPKQELHGNFIIDKYKGKKVLKCKN